MDNFVDYDKKFLNFSMRQSLLSKEDEIEYIKNWQIKKDQKSLNKIEVKSTYSFHINLGVWHSLGIRKDLFIL